MITDENFWGCLVNAIFINSLNCGAIPTMSHKNELR